MAWNQTGLQLSQPEDLKLSLQYAFITHVKNGGQVEANVLHMYIVHVSGETAHCWLGCRRLRRSSLQMHPAGRLCRHTHTMCLLPFCQQHLQGQGPASCQIWHQGLARQSCPFCRSPINTRCGHTCCASCSVVVCCCHMALTYDETASKPMLLLEYCH